MEASELFVLVDEHDRVLGSVSPQRCLREGLRHQAVAVLLFNAGGELYIQLRSQRMQWYPNVWTASATGHVRYGETYKQAALRELQEELGIRCKLRMLGKLLTPTWRYGEVTELEFITVFEGHWNEMICPRNEEVAGGEYIALDRLGREIAEGARNCTPDLLLALALLRRDDENRYETVV